MTRFSEGRAEQVIEGRVVDISGKVLRVCDAYRCREVELRGLPPLQLTPGDLVRVRAPASTDGSGLRNAELTLRCPGQLLSSGQFARFSRDGVGLQLQMRHRLMRMLRDWFEQEEFIEVNTPVRVPSPGTDVHLEPFKTERGWLITSPEFHMKRLLTGGLPRIFQVAQCHRQEERGIWHQEEFTLIEWYRAFSSIHQVLEDTEEIVRRSAELLVGRSAIVVGQRSICLEAPFMRLPLSEAYARFAGVSDAKDLSERDPAAYFQLWADRVEPELARLDRPVFITEYPISQAALARPCEHDPTVAERFELMIAGVELCNGFGELTDAAAQRQRFQQDRAARAREQARELPLDEGLLSALQEGMPPSGGNALGIERLLALCCQRPLAEVMAFPDPLEPPTTGEAE